MWILGINHDSWDPMLVSTFFIARQFWDPFPIWISLESSFLPSTLSQRTSDFYLGTCSQDLLVIMPGTILGAGKKAVNKKCFLLSRSLHHSHPQLELQTKPPSPSRFPASAVQICHWVPIKKNSNVSVPWPVLSPVRPRASSHSLS